MGDETTTDTVVGIDTAAAGANKRKATSTAPPDGYVCRLCSNPGHWIQVCPTKKTGTKNNSSSEGSAKRQRKSSDHVPVPGQDPSPEDIAEAKELQKIPPPKCFCGLPSRLNKVKRSKEGGENSRAVGKYFFFCSKKRDDETQCRYARPVDLERNKQKKNKDGGKQNKKDGGGDRRVKKEKNHNAKPGKSAVSVKTEKKPKQICKFFEKNGSCKKGSNCEFSHEAQTSGESMRD